MVKVLIAGDVCGSIDALYARVKDIFSKKAGPFDVLLCVGDFSSKESEEQLLPYLNGEKEAPVATYFFEPGDSPALAAKLSEHETDAVEVAKDIFYLGRGGIKTVRKLTVAFLARGHSRQDLEAIKRVSERPYFIGSDLLLTTDWPQGVEVDLPPKDFELLRGLGVHVAAAGHADNTEAALASRPRYHFAATRGAFFQRAPYRLPDPPGHVFGSKAVRQTRFIALGKVGGGGGGAGQEKNRKWMHAIGMEPVTHMSVEALAAEPDGTTDCPYVARRVVAGSSNGSDLKRGATNGGGGGGKRPKGEVWAEKIAQEDAAKRNDTGVFFFAARGGRGGGRGGGGRSGRGGRGGGPEEPVDPTMTGVFVGNLSNQAISVSHLEELFSRVGPLDGAPHLVPGKSFGFVEFIRHDDAARAIQTLNGYELMGYPLTVYWKKGRKREETSAGGAGAGGRSGSGFGAGAPEDAPVDPNNATVYVGSLNKEQPPSIEAIREAFVAAGCRLVDMVDIRVMEARGCAFVDFGSHAAAAAAIAACDGQAIGGPGGGRMRCSWSRKPTAIPGGGSGGEGGSGGGRAGGGGGGGAQQFPADPRHACWFCLASPELEDHLVASIGEHSYLALPKGGLSPDHILVVPVAHTARYSDLPADATAEVERYKAALREYHASKGLETIVFERCARTLGANHMHLQVLPVPRGETSAGARIILKVEGQRVGLNFEDVPLDADLREALAPEKAPQYFYAEVPGDAPRSYVRRLAVAAEDGDGGDGGRGGGRRSLPMQFGRGVAAKLLGRPELAHWKAAEASKEAETKLANVFKAAFKRFDFTMA